MLRYKYGFLVYSVMGRLAGFMKIAIIFAHFAAVYSKNGLYSNFYAMRNVHFNCSPWIFEEKLHVNDFGFSEISMEELGGMLMRSKSQNSCSLVFFLGKTCPFSNEFARNMPQISGSFVFPEILTTAVWIQPNYFNKNILTYYGVTGLPTLIIFWGDSMGTKMNNLKDISKVVHFIQKSTNISTSTIQSNLTSNFTVSVEEDKNIDVIALFALSYLVIFFSMKLFGSYLFFQNPR